MIRTAAVALTAAIVLTIAAAALAATITVKVNGNTIRNDVAPFTRHDTKFVQIQTVCKAVGADYKWEKEAKRITICKGDTCTSFLIGDGPKDAYVKNNHPCAAYKELARKLGGSATYDSSAEVISFTIK